MRKSLILIFCMFLAVSAFSATTDDFSEVSYKGKIFFTHNDLINSNYVIGIDKINYGSNTGIVDVKLILADKLSSGLYTLGLETNSKAINLNSIKVDGTTYTVTVDEFNNYVIPLKISLDQNPKEVILQLKFDPSVIGVREEFDVILYNEEGTTEKERIDPFLSGFDGVIEYFLNTSQLDGNVTDDMAYPVTLTPDLNFFWDTHDLGTSNGIEFTLSDETTTTLFHVEDFNIDARTATFWVLGTEIFDSDLNGSGFMYFDGLDIDNSDGDSAFNPDSEMVHHLQEESGATLLDDAEVHNSTSQNTISLPTEDCAISKCMRFNGVDTNAIIPSQAGLNFGAADHSASGWFFSEVNDQNQFMFGKRDDVESTGGSLIRDAPQVNSVAYTFGNNGQIFASVVDVNRWTHFMVTRSGTLWTTYLDGEPQSTAGQADSVSNATDFTIGMSGSFTRNFIGRLDEIEFFVRTFSADEVRLKYISQIFEETIAFDSNNVFLPLVTFATPEATVAPFLVGFNARQRLLLNTSQFPETTTNDHGVQIHITPDNISFWDNHPFTTSNGIEITSLDGETLIDWYAEDFNTITREAWFWAEVTADFEKDTNGTIYMYFQGADIDNQDLAETVFPTSVYAAVYTFEEDVGETILDQTANDHDDTNFSVTEGVTVNCILNKCVQFDGSSAIDVGTAATLNFGAGGFVLSAWVFVDNNSVNRQAYIAKKGSTGNFYEFGMGDIVTDLNTTYLDITSGSDQFSDSVQPVQEWIYVTAVRDASNNLDLYHNGQIVSDTITSNPASVSSTNPMTLGATSNSLDLFTGLMDHAFVMGDSITASEVQLLFANTIDEESTFGIDSGIADANVIQPLLLFGEAEFVKAPPELTIVHPNGGELFNKFVMTNVDINFTVKDIDTDSLIVDLNFSTSNVEGTGTVLVNDVNTNTGSIICEDSDFSDDTLCTFDWDITGVADDDYFILATVSDGFNSSVFDVSDAFFTIATPPDVNVVFPNGGEQFDKSLVSNVDINFLIGGSNETSFKIDLNFSTSNVEGTGTPIIVDENTMGALISCDTNDFTTPNQCTFSWDISGVPEGDFFILLNVEDSTSPSTDESDASFEIFENPTAIGTGTCEIDLQITLYLGQYLQITISGFDDNGTFVDSGTFDLFRDQEQLIEDEPLILVDRKFLTFISPKKINDDPYTLHVKAGNCVATEIVQTKFS